MMQSDSGFTLFSYVAPPSSGSGIALMAMLRFGPPVSPKQNQGELKLTRQWL
jgi:hypothetical protein